MDDEFSIKRLEKMQDPSKTPLELACDAAKAWVKESGAEHVIIVVGRSDGENGSATRYFQAGTYSYHAQMGLLWEGQQMIRESA
jgi:hypothetical protein